MKCIYSLMVVRLMLVVVVRLASSHIFDSRVLFEQIAGPVSERNIQRFDTDIYPLTAV